MTAPDRDFAFERALFASARSDGPTEEQRRLAYQALVASGALVAVGGQAVSQGTGLFGAGSVKVATWVGAGAVLGSALTFALLRKSEPPAVSVTPNVVVSVPMPSAATPLTARIEDAAKPSEQAPTASAEPSTARLPTARAPKAPIAKHQTTSSTAKPSDSTLAREVAALDRARTALWQGDFESTLLRVEAFHAEFPRSPLAPDAESLAIEALRGLGKEHAAAGRAERFLVRYPNDPQAPRVREPE